MDLVEEAAGLEDILNHTCLEDKKPNRDSDDCIPERWDNVMFKGYWLRTKYFGWERFCKSLGVPAFSLWTKYPGYERMASTVTLAGKMSYVAVGFVRSLNRKRPKGAPKMTKCPLTVKIVAARFRRMFWSS